MTTDQKAIDLCDWLDGEPVRVTLTTGNTVIADMSGPYDLCGVLFVCLDCVGGKRGGKRYVRVSDVREVKTC